MTERLTPERAVRLLRAKANELESWVGRSVAADPDGEMSLPVTLAADIALIAGLLADHIERDSHHPFAGPTWSSDIDDANVRQKYNESEEERFYG